MSPGLSPWRDLLRPRALKRNCMIAGVVGLALSTINQADVIAHGTLTRIVALKLAMNFVVPFIVSSVSAAAARAGEPPST